MLAGALTGAYAALEFCLWLELVYARRRRVPRPLILHGVAPSIDFSSHYGPYVAGEDLRAGQFVVIRDGKAYAPRDIRRPEPIHIEFTGTVNEEGLRALERLADEATAAMRVVGVARAPRRFTIEDFQNDPRYETFEDVRLDSMPRLGDKVSIEQRELVAAAVRELAPLYPRLVEHLLTLPVDVAAEVGANLLGMLETFGAIDAPARAEIFAHDERSTLYRGDALEAMSLLGDGSVDCLVCDPPYCSGGISEASRTRAAGQGLRSENIRRFGWFTGDNMGTAGLTFLLRSMAFEAMRVVKPTGSLLVFCDWRMIPTLAPAIESAGARFQNVITWDKTSMGLGNGFRMQAEFVLHFSLGDPEYFDKGTSNVIAAARVGKAEREDIGHQTPKPVPLLVRLLRVVCPVGGVVLDPFAGSGSTGVAALGLGMRFIGVERGLEEITTARRRLSEVQGVSDAGAEQPMLI